MSAMTSMALLTTLYLVGVAIGLLCIDGSATTKVGMALVWPLGLVAFALTITLLVGVAAIVFPMFGVGLGAAVIATWLLFT